MAEFQTPRQYEKDIREAKEYFKAQYQTLKTQNQVTTDQDFKVITCYNCQDKFFAWIPQIKSVNFCSYCWAKAGK